MTRHAGFPPVSSGRSVVLILGSLPGRMSLEAGEYYAHPQNGFWKLMGELFGAYPGLSYAKRKRMLTKHRVALWDVLAAAERKGSLDASIVATSMVPNDFRKFLRSHRSVRLICFNGQKAADLYHRKVVPVLGREFREMRLQTLPSTSPAHASMSFDEKLRRWSIALDGDVE
jgi:TDG/mug DNA glycosylase family protein